MLGSAVMLLLPWAASTYSSAQWAPKTSLFVPSMRSYILHHTRSDCVNRHLRPAFQLEYFSVPQILYSFGSR